MLTVKSVMGILLTAIPAILMFLLLYSVLSKKEPQSIKNRLKRGVKFLPLVIVVAAVGGIFAFGYQKVNDLTTASIRIGYNFPQASKGLAPSGIHLDVNEILGEKVLAETISRGGWSDITTEDLKNTLSITNLNPQSSVSAEKQYLSTEYKVSYAASPQTRNINGDELLTILSQTYQDFFTVKYGRKYNTINSDFSGLPELDYLDVYTYLKCRINNVADYMEMCSDVQSSSFVSGKTDESFKSVAEKARIYRDNALERYRGYILKYGISKDKGQYISRLNYDNQILNKSYMNNLVAYNARLAAIDLYDRDITTAVLVPTRDKDGEYYQSKTKIGTDYFAADANTYLEYVTDRQLDIETNNFIIQSFLEGSADSVNVKKADEMISELQTQIIQISKLAEDTIRDYDTRNSENNLSFTLDTNSKSKVPGLREALFYSALVFIMAFATAFAGIGKPIRKKAGE